mmetsp:Transcript_110178/g.322426  ORF Transcript_110178/g.322426 Transcript_110178/m.322426 type:complete len:314 (-) Transcript_110178:416-1357(-)
MHGIVLDAKPGTRHLEGVGAARLPLPPGHDLHDGGARTHDGDVGQSLPVHSDDDGAGREELPGLGPAAGVLCIECSNGEALPCKGLVELAHQLIIVGHHAPEDGLLLQHEDHRRAPVPRGRDASRDVLPEHPPGQGHKLVPSSVHGRVLRVEKGLGTEIAQNDALWGNAQGHKGVKGPVMSARSMDDGLLSTSAQEVQTHQKAVEAAHHEVAELPPPVLRDRVDDVVLWQLAEVALATAFRTARHPGIDLVPLLELGPGEEHGRLVWEALLGLPCLVEQAPGGEAEVALFAQHGVVEGADHRRLFGPCEVEEG